MVIGPFPRGEIPKPPRGRLHNVPHAPRDEYISSDYVKSSLPQVVATNSMERNCRRYAEASARSARPRFSATPAIFVPTHATEEQYIPSSLKLSIDRVRVTPLSEITAGGSISHYSPRGATPRSGQFFHETVNSARSVSTAATSQRTPRKVPHRFDVLAQGTIGPVLPESAGLVAATHQLPLYNDAVSIYGYGKDDRQAFSLRQAAFDREMLSPRTVRYQLQDFDLRRGDD